jgi:O-antigen/teichoic acid export membrane protein
LSTIRRQSIKATVYTYIGVAVGFVTTALLFPKYLTPAEIGVLSLLVSYSLVLGQLGVLGLSGTITRYLPSFRDKQTGHKGFLSLILIVSVVGFLLSLVIFLVIKPYLIDSNIEESPLFVQYLDLIIPLTFFGILFTVLDVYNAALFVATTGTLLRDVVQRFLFVLFFLLVIIRWIDFHAYVYLYTLSICGITVLLILFLIYRKEFVLNFNFKRIDRTTLWAMGGYSFFSWLNGFSSLAVTRVDVILLNEYYNTTMTGIYATTFYFATLIILPSRVFGKTSAIYLSEAFHQNDFKKIEKIHLKVSLNQWIVGLFIMLGLVCNLDNIFKILPPEYEAGKWVIILIGFSNLVRMIGGMDNAIIDFSKEYKLLSLFLIIFLVLQIVLSLILIPDYQMEGAAWAALLAVSFFTIIKATYIYYKMKIVSFSMAHFVALVIAGVVFMVLYYLPAFDNYLVDITIRSTIITALFGGTILLLKVSDDLNQLFVKGIAWLRLK